MGSPVTSEEAITWLSQCHPQMTPGPYPMKVMEPWPMICGHCKSSVSPRLNALKNGQGPCAKCAIDTKAKNQRISRDSAVEWLAGNYPDMTPIEPYPDSTLKPWTMICDACGSTCSPTLGPLRSKEKHACKTCALEARGLRSRITPYEAVEWVAQNCPTVTPVEPYPGKASLPWAMTCNTCGHSFDTRLARLRRGHSPCRPCSEKRIPGLVNYTTLSRNSVYRWENSNLYIRRILDLDRFVYKVGIGSKHRAAQGRGDVIMLYKCPRVIAWLYEQKILNAHPRVELFQPLRSGNTEVIESLDSVKSILVDLLNVVYLVESDLHARARFDSMFTGLHEVKEAA